MVSCVNPLVQTVLLVTCVVDCVAQCALKLNVTQSMDAQSIQKKISKEKRQVKVFQ